MFETHFDPIQIPNASGANMTLDFDAPQPQVQDFGESPRWHPDPDSLEACMDRDPSIRRWIFAVNFSKGAS